MVRSQRLAHIDQEGAMKLKAEADGPALYLPRFNFNSSSKYRIAGHVQTCP